MPRPRRAHPDFEPASLYEYPEHLRATLADLPAAPGVYIFHGKEGDLPLYIGKSVNLRQRVLSHLRTVEEARMLRQTRRISHLRTAGGIGALLLEAQLIKTQHPLFNQKLRRSRQLCALTLQDGLPRVVEARQVDFAHTPDLYGLFASRHAALDGLRALADTHRLCLGAMGLEKLAPGRPCFRAMVHRCAGVCRGDESLQAHHDRLAGALRDLALITWPYAGAIGIEEQWEDERQIHVVRNWCYLGSAPTLAQARALDSVTASFDADSYKILCKPILDGSARLVALD